MGFLDFLGNIIDGLFGIGETAANISAAEDQQGREHAQQKQLLQIQNDFTHAERMDAQEYNSPQATLQRYLDLGINPDAAVQSILGNPTPAVGAQSSVAPQVPSAIGAISSALSGLDTDFFSKAYRNTLMKKQIESIDIDNSIKPLQNAREERRVNAEIDKMQADKQLSETTATQMREMLPYLKDKTQAEIDLAVSSSQKALSEIDKIKKSMDVDDATIDKLVAETQRIEKLTDAELDQIISKTNLNIAKTSESTERTAFIGEQVTSEQLKQDLESLKIAYEEWLKSFRDDLGIDVREIGGILGGFGSFLRGFGKLFSKAGKFGKAAKGASKAAKGSKGAKAASKAAKGSKGAKAASTSSTVREANRSFTRPMSLHEWSRPLPPNPKFKY